MSPSPKHTLTKQILLLRVLSLAVDHKRSFRGLGFISSVSETINFLENFEGSHEEDLVRFSVVSTLTIWRYFFKNFTNEFNRIESGFEENVSH